MKLWRCATSSRRPTVTAGYLSCPIYPRRIKLREKYLTELGFLPMSTSGYTKRHGQERSLPSIRDGNMPASRCTITCYSWLTRDYVLTKHPASNFEMSPSSPMKRQANASSKLKSEANVELVTARACRVQ